MISFAPFLLSGSPRSRSRCWCGLPLRATSRSIARVNLALIVLAVATVYRVTTLARSGLLWRVSRKLILSYILVGAVPILLLVTFSLLAFLLVFFDISSYLVHDRVAHLTEQASVFGRTTMFEIERAAPSEHAEIIQRRQSAIASQISGRVGRAGARATSCRSGCRAQALRASSIAERLRGPCCFRAAAGRARRGRRRSPGRQHDGRGRACGGRHHAGRAAPAVAVQHRDVPDLRRLGHRRVGADADRHERRRPDAVQLDGGQPEWRRRT